MHEAAADGWRGGEGVVTGGGGGIEASGGEASGKKIGSAAVVTAC